MSIAKKILDNNLTAEEFYSNIKSAEDNKMDRQVVILSATLTGDTIENINFKNKTLRNILKDINLTFGEGLGVYKNQAPEVSFAVIVNSNDDIKNIESLAFNSFNQESVLLVDSNMEASLSFSNGKIVTLGKLEQVSKETALKLGNYTILNHNYYAIPNPLG